jgi:hypothetical protein
VDTDVVCLRADIPKFNTFFAWEDGGHVNSAVLYFPAGHPAMLRCYDEAIQAGYEIQWGQTGPQLLTRVLSDLRILDEALASTSCYPVRSSNALDALEPENAHSIRSQAAHSLFYHAWNEILRRNGIDRNVLPPRGSFLRELADLHPVPGWREPNSESAAWVSTALQKRADERWIALWLISQDPAARRSFLSAKTAPSGKEVADAIAGLITLLEHDTRLPVPPDFDDAAYLAENPDVLAAVEAGVFSSGFNHYILYGRHEGRRRSRPGVENPPG